MAVSKISFTFVSVKKKQTRCQTKNFTTMSKQQVLGIIEELAHSQGFYGRLLEQLNNDENMLNILCEHAKGFKDELDLIFFLEC